MCAMSTRVWARYRECVICWNWNCDFAVNARLNFIGAHTTTPINIYDFWRFLCHYLSFVNAQMKCHCDLTSSASMFRLIWVSLRNASRRNLIILRATMKLTREVNIFALHELLTSNKIWKFEQFRSNRRRCRWNGISVSTDKEKENVFHSFCVILIVAVIYQNRKKTFSHCQRQVSRICIRFLANANFAKRNFSDIFFWCPTVDDCCHVCHKQEEWRFVHRRPECKTQPFWCKVDREKMWNGWNHFARKKLAKVFSGIFLILALSLTARRSLFPVLTLSRQRNHRIYLSSRQFHFDSFWFRAIFADCDECSNAVQCVPFGQPTSDECACCTPKRKSETNESKFDSKLRQK